MSRVAQACEPWRLCAPIPCITYSDFYYLPFYFVVRLFVRRKLYAVTTFSTVLCPCGMCFVASVVTFVVLRFKYVFDQFLMWLWSWASWPILHTFSLVFAFYSVQFMFLILFFVSLERIESHVLHSLINFIRNRIYSVVRLEPYFVVLIERWQIQHTGKNYTKFSSSFY